MVSELVTKEFKRDDWIDKFRSFKPVAEQLSRELKTLSFELEQYQEIGWISLKGLVNQIPSLVKRIFAEVEKIDESWHKPREEEHN